MRRWTIRSFYVVPYFFIQVNIKFDVSMQSTTRIIVYGAKCAFKNFRVQNIIRSIVWVSKA